MISILEFLNHYPALFSKTFSMRLFQATSIFLGNVPGILFLDSFN